MANDIQKGDEPDWLHLSPTEEVLWDGRQTAYSLIGATISGVIVAVAGIVGTALLMSSDFLDTFPLAEQTPSIAQFAPLILTVFAVIYLFFVYLSWRLTYYVVTTEELYHRRGIVSQNVQQMRINRIQNTTCNQSFLERLLSYGDITIFTAGSDDYDFIFENVPSPQSVNRRLTTQLGEMENDTAGTSFEEGSGDSR